MTHTIDNVLSKAFAHSPWLFAHDVPRDAIMVLSEALGPRWAVQRETDCDGEVSIIVLPIADEAKPAFVLYEKEGVARVATVVGDDWEGDQGFANFPDAVATIIAAAESI